MHILVLMAFVTPTMSGLAIAMPAEHHRMKENISQKVESSGDYHHISHQMEKDHSCCENNQMDPNNTGGDKQCCDGDCQCMMNGCAKTQMLHNFTGVAYAPISIKTLFMTHNKRHDDAISYLLKWPPEA